MKQTGFMDFRLFPPFDGFPLEGIKFLAQLKKNNNREWFAKHKHEYEEFVKLPMQSIIASLQAPLSKIVPELDVNPTRSIFRIYRDTRFSKNKTPYKTHVAAVFHPKGHWEEGAGYYLHIEPSEIYLGGGIYMPNGPQLKKIRTAIAAHPKEFRSIVEHKKFKKRFGNLEGAKLQRNPKGFSIDDPMIEWLKFKQFFTGVSWKEKECYSVKFIDKAVVVYAELLPLIRFLNGALKQ